ncbi:hypothetical protein KUTeg_001494 [Tegillarca granosa]|uniref:Uncharacterized protein n=1 Tax=Tegillarca granosa TaxID=220873 RepID=A0ABQ9FT71_TEGGR|nr:hypothetical protein KUTeg_001494 [Tegillarca granosa]
MWILWTNLDRRLCILELYVFMVQHPKTLENYSNLRLITRITTTQARRHSEGQILARGRTKSESARVVSHAHPRFRAKSKSFQL